MASLLPDIGRLAGLALELGTNTSHRDLHGEGHWQSVAVTGLTLLEHTPEADPGLVLLFSVLHDAMREDDGWDPDHGRRAATFAEEHNGTLFHLSDDGLRVLIEACAGHADGATSDHPTIAVCWDADRLNLWRCAYEPEPKYLSTAAAADPQMIAWARDLHMRQFDWAYIQAAYVHLSQSTVR